MPELETPSLETPVTQEAPPTPQDASRAALYEQYYGQNGGNQPQQETPPATETTAQVVPPPEQAAPPSGTLPPEVVALIQNGSAQLAALQQELAELKSKVGQPIAVATASEAPPAEPSWVALLREGKVAEAEAALASAIQTKNKAELLAELSEQITNQTRDRIRAESEIATFVTEIRTQNTDLAPFEKWIAVEAQSLMADAKSKNLIHTTDDAIRYYKQSVTEAVNTARKAYQSIRGDGKTEANTRNREVLSSRPVPPQQVDTSRPPVTGDTQEAPMESTSEYLKRRTDLANRNKGLAPN